MKTQMFPTPANEWQNGLQTSGVSTPETGSQTPLSSPTSEVQGGQSSPKLAAVVYTVEEASVVLNVSTKTIRRLLDRGYLTCSSVLRKKLIPCKQIESFLKATCDVPKAVK